MISEAQVNHRFFVLGVLAAAIIPRHVISNQQHDNKCWLSTRIGGGMLSHNFRKLLLVIAMVNLCRLLSSGRSHQLVSDVLGILEVTLLTFLCFLTPYVLQVGLSQFFNIVPGSDLKAPLCASALLSFFGVALSRRVHPNFWALKKLANACCVWPAGHPHPEELQHLHHVPEPRPRAGSGADAFRNRVLAPFPPAGLCCGVCVQSPRNRGRRNHARPHHGGGEVYCLCGGLDARALPRHLSEPARGNAWVDLL